jgi:hypothetical protein
MNEQLDAIVGRHDVLIRQLQGQGVRVVDALPALGRTGDMVLFNGDVWIDNGTDWKQLVYA